ncbi:acetate and sugar kinases/Hsc70/actin family protein [Saccharomonospora glauca]|uniref:Uncharacterized protein n=1 Tax=Saccharomonospora glauca K62 TaxID=928724 RepID=I1D5N8_9PSEU|nr:hypothetical protein [Saccharomonospora glauca]EIF00263.1 hypothetical protein SacglDRAFT_03402 [Saccharomonospora glauca K62]
MSGFGVDLEHLYNAADYVSDAAILASRAQTGVRNNQVDAPRPLPIPDLPWEFGIGPNDSAGHVFGSTLGFDAIAFAYSQHVDAMVNHLGELQESASSGSRALTSVAKLYERIDEAGQL